MDRVISSLCEVYFILSCERLSLSSHVLLKSLQMVSFETGGDLDLNFAFCPF